jgi:hypothetical protein
MYDKPLTNLDNTLYYDENGLITQRVGISGGSVSISGPVTIPGTVTVNSTPASPVHVHLTEIGAVDLTTATSLPVSGSVSVTSMPEVEIKNDAGNPVPVTWVYGNSAAAIPWELQVARGKIPGVTGLSIAGYCPNIGTDWAPIWEYDRPYTYLPTAQQLRVWSNSASDTNVTVAIQGLDENYVPITETITLNNGTTGVMTQRSYFRINSMNVTQLPMNVGNISIGNSAKTIECATIMPDAGRSQMCIYTVPAGYTFYLTQANVLTNQVGSQTAIYRSYTRQPNGVTNSIIIFPFVQTYNSRKVCARPYTEKTDIQWQAQSSQGTSRIGGQIEGFLIANSTS